jgi:hypothetical protein
MLHASFLTNWFMVAGLTLLTNPETISNTINHKTLIKWIVEKSSTLSVSGKSNINEFTCDIVGYYGPDTITCGEDGGSGKAVRLNGRLELDVFKFDCHSRLLTKDLRKTLKAEEYPKLAIRFLTLEHIPSFQMNTQNMKGWVEVELAGTRKCFQIDYEFARNTSNSFLLNGKRTFCFSDFKLTPPKKLAGVIKVKDEFNVNFQLKLFPTQ